MKSEMIYPKNSEKFRPLNLNDIHVRFDNSFNRKKNTYVDEIINKEKVNYENNINQILFNQSKFRLHSIEIQNGTKISGLAYEAKLTLEKLDYNVIGINNAQKQDYEKTVIYDFSDGRYSYTIKALKDKFEANVSQVPLSEEDRENKADIVVILGQDYVNY